MTLPLLLAFSAYFWDRSFRCLYSMKWINCVVVAGGICLINIVPLISWSQPQQSAKPAQGMASVEGSVQDAATKRPIVSATVVAKNQAGVLKAQQLTNADGSFSFKLDPKQSYLLSFQAPGYDTYDEPLVFTSSRVESLKKRPTLLYLPGTRPASTPPPPAPTAATSAVAVSNTLATAQSTSGNTASTTNARVAPPKTLDAKVVYTPPLVVAAVGKTTQLRAIQFVQSKPELLPDAMPALEQLLQFLQGKPTAEIELSGHTDNQGDFDENLRLSKQRVEVVKEYLVKNGIAASRITTRGYGPTRPIASNNTETTRQLNRRVEMIVVKE